MRAGLPRAVRRLRQGAPRVRRPIGRNQAIAFALADLAVAVENARNLTYKAAWLKDQGRPFTQAAAIAKLYSTEAAVTATRVATQVFGGAGFIEETPIARFYRDAKILEIGEGTSEIQRLVHRPRPRPAGRVAGDGRRSADLAAVDAVTGRPDSRPGHAQ